MEYTEQNPKLKTFIDRFDPKVASVIRSCRTALRHRFPASHELVYDNYNFFVIGYSATSRPSDCVVSLGASKNGVVLSFYYGATLDDPDGVLLGTGNQNRFVRLPTAKTLSEPAVAALIDQAEARGRAPMPNAGRITTIVRSISAKQRPRR